MSFSSEAKEELCRAGLNRGCCTLAEAYGVLLYCHTFDLREIRIITAGDAFAARNPQALKIDFERRPPLFEVSTTHFARTWLLHPDAPKVEPPPVLKRLRQEVSL